MMVIEWKAETAPLTRVWLPANHHLALSCLARFVPLLELPWLEPSPASPSPLPPPPGALTALQGALLPSPPLPLGRPLAFPRPVRELLLVIHPIDFVPT